MTGPVDVFICYAEADQGLCDELVAHLAGLQHHGVSVGKGEQKKWLPRDGAASAGEAGASPTTPTKPRAPRR